MTSPLTFGSLFTGIGGLDLGLERAGLKCAWQVEINNYATKVLEKHWPHVARFRDVRNIGRHIGDIHTCYIPVSPVDVLVGGFPCQPHSLAGKRRASTDERDLWGEFYRLICELNPCWVLAENVPGLLSSENGRFFGAILRDLAQAGYDAEWACFQARNFGYPHIRERVFLLAYPSCKRWPRILRDWPECGQATTQREKTASLGNVWDRLAQFEQRTGEPSVLRSDDGLPDWMDRLRCLGNAVVPDIAEHIGRCIVAAHLGTPLLIGAQINTSLA